MVKETMSTATTPKPEKIMQFLFSHVPTQALCTAVELELFSHIQNGHTTPKSLASQTAASERGLFLLTNALCAMGLLTKNEGNLALTPDSEMFLVKGGHAYLGGLTSMVRDSWQTWNRLTEAVKSGTTPAEAELEQDRGAFFSSWVDGLFNLNYPAAKAAAEKLAPKAGKILDLGAGSGVWSLALAQAQPRVQVVAMDLQPVIDSVTRPFAERLGVVDRYEFRAENLHHAELGTEEFEVVTLGHILHSEGDEQCATLLARIYRALKPGGILLVAEMIPDEQRSQHMFGNLFGLNMLMNTHHGTVYTASELEQMMKQAGFSQNEWLQAPAPFPLLLAHK